MFVFDQLKKSDPHLRVLTWVVLGGLLLLLGGLWYIQVATSKRYVENQMAQYFRSVRIPAVRGRILDRNGLALAENRPTFNLCLYLEELSKQFQAAYLEAFTNAAAQARRTQQRKLSREERVQLGQQVRYQVVSNAAHQVGGLLQQPLFLEPAVFQKHYQERLALPLPILHDLNSNQLARLQELPFVPRGIDFEVHPLRVYPYGATAAHILGYLSRDDQPVVGEDAFFNYLLPDFAGVVGIEAAFDEYLRGKAGYKSVLVNSLGYRQSESLWNPAEPGSNVVLTLDVPLQRAVEAALRSAQADPRGAAVVMEARSGDILALASTPAFEPGRFIPRISHQEMLLLNDTNRCPLINRATQGRYAPGSIFKIVTALAGLEAGVINPTNLFANPGFAQVGDRRIHDQAPPGPYDFKRAFKLSSNSYFIHYGLQAGLKHLLDFGRRFCLGEPMDFPTLQTTRGSYPTEERLRALNRRGNPWTEGDTANLCIGQGDIIVNPLQMAVMTAAVANGGKVLWPRLVQRVEPFEPTMPGEDRQVQWPNRLRGELGVQPRHLQLVREAMLADVEDGDGTGRAAAVPGLRIGGKTGTAEIEQRGHVVDKTTWFVAFAPFEHPKYVVVVVIESGASGGHTCAPVAGRIFRAILERESQGKIRPASLAQWKPDV